MEDNIMKKIIALILALICVFALCACDENAGKIKISFTRGETNEHVYLNESINIKFTKTEDMVYATDEELAAMMRIGLETLTNNKELFDLAATTCFLAKDVISGNNVVCVMENLTVTGSSNITNKQYIEAVKAQLNGQTSVKYTIGEVSSAKLGNESYDVLSLTAQANGVTMAQNMYIRKVGTHMVVITITVTDGTAMSTYEAMFS
jgi:hypothetical protein